MELYTVDKVSDGLVTLLLRRDESVQVVVPVGQLPEVKEGDLVHISFDDGLVKSYQVDVNQTAKQKEKIEAKLDKLKRKGKRDS